MSDKRFELNESGQLAEKDRLASICRLLGASRESIDGASLDTLETMKNMLTAGVQPQTINLFGVHSDRTRAEWIHIERVISDRSRNF